MANAPQRDDTHGTAASASATNYRGRRQGDLTRASDGFRSPTLPVEPRRPLEAGHQVDPPLMPYAYNPRPPETVKPRNIPRTFQFFRPASPGAPYAPSPDAQRTQGHLQQSGAAWGHVGEPQRAVLTPARDGNNAPPSHELGRFVPGSASAIGPRWRRPSSPVLRDHMPH